MLNEKVFDYFWWILWTRLPLLENNGAALALALCEHCFFSMDKRCTNSNRLPIGEFGRSLCFTFLSSSPFCSFSVCLSSSILPFFLAFRLRKTCPCTPPPPTPLLTLSLLVGEDARGSPQGQIMGETPQHPSLQVLRWITFIVHCTLTMHVGSCPYDKRYFRSDYIYYRRKPFRISL